jgi:purine-nucleoside phosphorylase
MEWRYRGYEFWRFADFCMILAGLGSGSLEPLMFEALRPGIIRKIVLVGTAGSMPDAQVELTAAHLIDPAWPAATAIDGEVGELPLRPRWSRPTSIKTASGVSSDFFYGFAPRVLSNDYPIRTRHLRALFEQHLRLGTQLVDMEAAQFYFFCTYLGGSSLEYAAVKAVANAVGGEAEQSPNTRKAIANCLTLAFRLLDLPHHAAPSFAGR